MTSLYRKYPRIFWTTFLAFGYVFILIQTYIAEPRSLNAIAIDMLFPTLILFSTFIVFLSKNSNTLLVIGGLYLVLTFSLLFFDFIPKEYGTFTFLFGVWLVVDYINYRRLRTSVYHELVKGNYTLAAGVFVSTFIFGAITEIVNLPFYTWSYNIPFPSLSFGIPALIAAFGWTPWTLSILAIFYGFIAKD